jgi:arginase family enzyme
MKRLSEITDTIYIHVDMDVLDRREVPGHHLSVPRGPTSAELAAALTDMFRYEKVGAFGIASALMASAIRRVFHARPHTG